MNEQSFESLQEIGEAITAALHGIEQEQETYWASLSTEQQLQVFCAVIRRLYQGEIKNRGSYRHVLYDVFGFGPESYARAQDAGFLDIHNAITVDSQP